MRQRIDDGLTKGLAGEGGSGGGIGEGTGAKMVCWGVETTALCLYTKLGKYFVSLFRTYLHTELSPSVLAKLAF